MKKKQRKAQHDDPEELPDLMTALEVARYFGVKVRRVRGWDRRRVLTPVLRRGERVYMACEVEHLGRMHGWR